jgi:hypothetical protein
VEMNEGGEDSGRERGRRKGKGSIRWVDHADHAALAVSWDCAVEPDGIGVIDSDSEDIGLPSISTRLCLRLAINGGAHILTRARLNESTPESSPISRRHAWRGEGRLRDGVTWWEEVELDHRSHGGSDCVWREREAALPGVHDLYVARS